MDPCQVGANLNRVRAKLQTNYNLPKSMTNRMNAATICSSYRRCKDANSFPPMKSVKSGQYMYYIDSRCVLTVGNYEKIMRRGTYLEDIRRIATKLGLSAQETKKEQIRSNIFEFLQKSGIAEPIRIKVSCNNKSYTEPSKTASNGVSYTPPSNTASNGVPYTPPINTASNGVPYTPHINGGTSSYSNNPVYKSNFINNNSRKSKPTYKAQFVKNQAYDGYTRTNPGQLRFRIPSSSYSNNDFFRRKNRGTIDFFDQKNNDNNTELKRQIQAKYRQNGVTDVYLFKYFKGRDPNDQINLNRFMNKYIPLSMRKKPMRNPNTPGPKTSYGFKFPKFSYPNLSGLRSRLLSKKPTEPVNLTNTLSKINSVMTEIQKKIGKPE